jgi:hypothetical protein
MHKLLLFLMVSFGFILPAELGAYTLSAAQKSKIMNWENTRNKSRDGSPYTLANHGFDIPINKHRGNNSNPSPFLLLVSKRLTTDIHKYQTVNSKDWIVLSYNNSTAITYSRSTHNVYRMYNKHPGIMIGYMLNTYAGNVFSQLTPPINNITPNRTSVDEGGNVVFQVYSNTHKNQWLHLRVDGTAYAGDLNWLDNGVWMDGNGNGWKTIQVLQDVNYDPNEQFYIQLRRFNRTGPWLKNSAVITVVDKVDPIMGKLTLPNSFLEGKVQNSSKVLLKADFTKTGSRGVIRY